MKKVVSLVLIFILSIQLTATNVYAQNSPQSEAQELMDCMDRYLLILQTSIQSRVADSYVMTTQHRVETIKHFMAVLLMDEYNTMKTVNGVGIAIGMMALLYSVVSQISDHPELKKEIADLKAFQDKHHLNGAELAKKGGPEGIENRIKTLREIIKNSKVSRITRFVFPAAILLTTIMLTKIAWDSSKLNFSAPAINSIEAATTEIQIQNALMANEIMINDLRKKALDRCLKDDVLSDEEKNYYIQAVMNELAHPTDVPGVK